METYQDATNSLVVKIDSMSKEEKGKAQEPTADVFLNALTLKELKEIKKAGDKFLKMTSLIRANYWYNKKDEILDPQTESYKDLDARSLNVMLDEVINFPALLLSEVERLLVEKGVDDE